MQITRQADYAVRTVVYLANLGPDQRTSTAEIGRKQHIPVTFLAKIVSQLSAAGIIHTLRGAHGGVSLGRPAGEISLLDIVETIDGPMLLNKCVADPDLCPFGSECAVHQVWCLAQTELVERLSRTSMAQLSRQQEHLTGYAVGERQADEPFEPMEAAI